MSKQSFTVLIMAIAGFVGFGPGCGVQEPTAPEQATALKQTSVAGPLQTISSDKTDSELKSPSSDSVVPKSAERPPGKCCFAQCGGDGWGGWHPLWWVDEGCNSKAADFCRSQGWSLINAEWLSC